MPSGIIISQPNPSSSSSKDYGAFIDTTTQTLLAAFQEKVVEIGNTIYSNGVSIGANQLVFNNAGTYDIQVSLQVTNTHNQAHEFYLWFAYMGITIPESLSIATIPSTHGGNNGHYILSLNLFVQVNAGDKVELRWSADDNRVQIETIPAPFGTLPASPSVILTATQV